MYNTIPGELKKLPNWVCWQAVNDEVRCKIKKLPINPITGGQAQSNNPETWTDFDTAVNASSNYSGIGLMFSNCDYFGVDIDGISDDVQNYKSGDSNNIIAEFVNTLQSYAEYSQSGNGIHIICRGVLPKGGRRKGNVEMYENGRFFIMTGNSLGEYPDINDCTDTIKSLHEKYIGGGREPVAKRALPSTPLPNNAEDILKLALNAKNGDLFRRLYSGDSSGYTSQSEADMAFCNLLAFWCRCDANLMDCIYRRSGLMRDKWNRKQSGSTYGIITLQKAIAECNNVYDPAKYRSDNQFSINITERSAVIDQKIKLYTFDDTGNAQRLIDLFGDNIRYCYTDKKWMYYDGRKWCTDYTGAIERIADKSVEAMTAEAKAYEEEDEDMADKFKKHCKNSRSNKSKSAMLKEVMHHVPVLPMQLDRHKFLVNTPGGVLNLKNGEIMQHHTEQYITKMSNIEYTEKADCPQWSKFLNDIFNGDKELIRYIQKAVGYSMTGSTAEQCVFFLFGTGRNGKSTFLDVIREIMGDYATNIQPETIMIRQNQSGAINSDIARLKGSRFVTSVEPNEGVRINEGLLKQLTGDDAVTARKLYGEEFEFKPEFKLWMATNHKPIIRGTDTGIWRRIHMIPFTVQIPEDKIDRNLKYKLKSELSAIMHWAVEGCLLWQREGLRMPKAVMRSVKEYRREMDVISAFVDDMCNEGEGLMVQASRLYAAYAQWCNDNNEYKMSNTKFGVEISKKFDKLKSKQAYFYAGLNLIN